MDWIETKIRVRYEETDKMGVVYHSNYFVWFEVGRTEMIRGIGINYKDMETLGYLLPVLDANCSYKHSALYDDEVIIKTRISYYNGLKMDFVYEAVRAEDNKLLAAGTTKHVWVDKDYRPVRLDKKLPDIHQKIIDFVSQNN